MQIVSAILVRIGLFFAIALLTMLIAKAAFGADLTPPQATFAERFGHWRATAVWVWTPSTNGLNSRLALRSLGSATR
jgi:hypothetical protein